MALCLLFFYLLLDRATRRIFPSSPSISIDGPFGSGESYHLDESNVLDCASSYNKCTCYAPCLRLLLTVWAGHVTIDLLPDDVILNVFHFVRAIYAYPMRYPDGLTSESYLKVRNFVEWRQSWWHPLIHVCRMWRSVIFASPKFLNLKLVCVPYTRAELMDIWPLLPIIIISDRFLIQATPEDLDFDIAIVHHNRVCEIDLHLTRLQLERWPLAMQVQFPALTRLALLFRPEFGDRPLAPALPDGFLGGSAPNLQSLELFCIPFPAIPNLLLSATNLVRLSLWEIPHSGYISPEVFITALAVLVNLKSLMIGFESPASRPNPESRRPWPPSRTLIPALTKFTFQGASEYVEVFVAQIDVPLLEHVSMTFFHQLIFDTPQLAQFMRCATGSKALNDVHVDFRQHEVLVEIFSQTGTFRRPTILCRVLEWQLSSFARLFKSFFPSIYTVENLYIHSRSFRSEWQSQLRGEIENVQWLEIFRPFTAMKNLYISGKFVQCITTALQELVEERLMGVLPALENIFLEGFQSSRPVQEAIGQFVAARQLSGRPVATFHWNIRQRF